MMRNKLWSRRGQSILEYLVVVAVVVAGIIAAKGSLQNAVEGLGTESEKTMKNARVKLEGLGIMKQ